MKKISGMKTFAERLEFSTLTEAEKEEIRKTALETVEKERHARAEEACMVVAMDEARKSLLPEAEMTDIFIDLPGHAARILIDGVEYLHGFTYPVTIAQAATMTDIMQRAWDHEDEVGGANRNFYRKPRHQTLTRQHRNVSTRQLAGV
jgi:hypothetical protein